MVTMSPIPADQSNSEQLRAWDGDEGACFDTAIAGYHRHFMAAAAIEDTARVLDIGCGTGQTTRDAARSAASGWALGVDLSRRMIDVARQVAERRPARVADRSPQRVDHRVRDRDADRASALDALRATIDAHSTDRGVRYESAAWLITAERPA